LTWLGLLLAFALVVAACGDDDAADTTAAPGTTEAPTTTEAATTTAAPESTTTTEAAPEGKPYGGEVIVADAQEPPTLNPKVPGGTNFIVAVIGQGHLVGVQNLNGNTLEFDPDVVEELPTTENGGVVINDDGTMTVSYTIKDEAVWADGTPIRSSATALKLATRPSSSRWIRPRSSTSCCSTRSCRPIRCGAPIS
jgi:hypothetical protein